MRNPLVTLGPSPHPDGSVSPVKGAWFLDIDGTLLEIAETPAAVRVPEEVTTLLLRLQQRSAGALALVSGRSLQQIDALFEPYQFTAAGLHGYERRDSLRRIHRPPLPEGLLDEARSVLAGLAAQKPGLVFEDKRHALALHYRLAPAFEADAHAAVTALAERLSPLFVMQGGKCVWELKPAGYSKRQAIEAFMQESPFMGRTAVFVGDDVTDEGGFAAVNLLGGLSIKVAPNGGGTPTAAQRQIATVKGVIEWLQAALDRPIEQS
jgi:trehalose 6-phosphate phosphatase